MLLDFSYPDIVNQCNTMTYLNVISFCLLSGCGHVERLKEPELKKIKRLVDDDKKVENVFFTSSLYKRCLPKYMHEKNHKPNAPVTGNDNFSDLMWQNKKQKKAVHSEVLSLSISCMAALAEKISNEEIVIENSSLITHCLIQNAIRQANFIQQYLKVGDIYYDGEDISNNSDALTVLNQPEEHIEDEIHVELDTNSPRLLTQFLVIESFLSLMCLLKTNKNTEQLNLLAIDKDLDLLPVICDNVLMNLNTLTSRELSLICLSLVSSYQSANRISDFNNETTTLIYSVMTTIGCELKERLWNSGEISRSIIDGEASSIITLFNCLNCFSSLYALTDMDRFYDAALCVYQRVNLAWDKELNLFILLDSAKVKYTIKDIAFTLSALKAFRNIQTNPELFMQLEKQTAAFYRAALLNSKIFNCQSYPILQDEVMTLHKFGTISKDTAPVFKKSFEVKRGKNKYYCEADVFQADYVLCACKFLLRSS